MYSTYNPFCLKNILGFIILIYSLGTFSQTLGKPELTVSAIDPTPVTFVCARSGFSNYGIRFQFTDAPFNADNVFKVILSDPDGSFVSGTKEIGSIANANFLFDVSANVSFNDIEIYGSNYKIRIESDDPAMIGPESDPFGAYFRPNINLQLDPFNDLCDGASATLALNIDGNPAYDQYDFVWYKRDVPNVGPYSPLVGETGTSIEVTQGGQYYATFEMGLCTNSLEANPPSNATIVNSISVDAVNIQGQNTVSICSDETYDLVASIDDPTYTYNWYKDNELITGLAAYLPTYTTPDVDQFGTYFVEIETAGGCTARSQDVVVQPTTAATFDPIIQGSDIRIILPTETIELELEDLNSSSLTYQWYDQNGIRTSNTQATINIIGPGEYFVEVTDSSSSCPVSDVSQTITVLAVDSLSVVIRTDTEYVECNVATTDLSVLGVKALATDGLEYDLSDEQQDLLNFQWYKDTVLIAGADASTFNVASYEDFGSYHLEISVGGGVNLLQAASDPLDVLLAIDLEIVSSSVSNKICPGGTINLSIDIVTGYTYEWFKDDVLLTVTDISNIDVSEVGIYYVTYEGFGCLNQTASIEIVEFDASVLEVSPSTTAVLIPGETTTLIATGADSYEWYNENGDLLSSSDVLDVNSLGIYTLIGRVDACQVEKEVTVVEDDGSFTIPNIISPFNGDNVNDTWQIPNKFAFQTNVTVIIYNSRGKELVNTTDYQNNWPEDNNIKAGMLFYFKVVKEDVLIKAGTISVLE